MQQHLDHITHHTVKAAQSSISTSILEVRVWACNPCVWLGQHGGYTTVTNLVLQLSRKTWFSLWLKFMCMILFFWLQFIHVAMWLMVIRRYSYKISRQKCGSKINIRILKYPVISWTNNDVKGKAYFPKLTFNFPILEEDYARSSPSIFAAMDNIQTSSGSSYIGKFYM